MRKQGMTMATSEINELILPTILSWSGGMEPDASGIWNSLLSCGKGMVVISLGRAADSLATVSFVAPLDIVPTSILEFESTGSKTSTPRW